MSSLIVGIAGGSGSGKTTITKGIFELLGPGITAVVPADSYYKGRSYQPEIRPESINYDHPDALDIPLLVCHLKALSNGQPIARPVYSFVTHSRTGEFVAVEPRPVILVEGLLILAQSNLRELFDIKIFVDTDDDVRFIRRLERDTAERGRNVEDVVSQYLETVKPMHLAFIEPCKQYADLIVAGMNEIGEAVEAIITKINSVRLKKAS